VSGLVLAAVLAASVGDTRVAVVVRTAVLAASVGVAGVPGAAGLTPAAAAVDDTRVAAAVAVPRVTEVSAHSRRRSSRRRHIRYYRLFLSCVSPFPY